MRSFWKKGGSKLTNFKQYFRKHLLSNRIFFIVVLAIALVVTVAIGYEQQPSKYYDRNVQEYYLYYEFSLRTPKDILILLACVIPVVEFSCFKKRSSLDCVYSFPISRRDMGCIHYLTGLIKIFLVFSASYLVNFIQALSHGAEWFNFEYLIPYYFICLFFGFAFYSLMVFAFNEANTVPHGIWYMIAYALVYYVFILALERITSRSIAAIILHGPIRWGALDFVTVHYQKLIELYGDGYLKGWFLDVFIIETVFWGIAGIASTLGFFFRFGKKRTEITGGISDSVFGARTFIPVFSVCVMIAGYTDNNILTYIAVQALTLLAYTVYRRGFHYKKSDIAVMCMLLIFFFV